MNNHRNDLSLMNMLMPHHHILKPPVSNTFRKHLLIRCPTGNNYCINRPLPPVDDESDEYYSFVLFLNRIRGTYSPEVFNLFHSSCGNISNSLLINFPSSFLSFFQLHSPRYFVTEGSSLSSCLLKLL